MVDQIKQIEDREKELSKFESQAQALSRQKTPTRRFKAGRDVRQQQREVLRQRGIGSQAIRDIRTERKNLKRIKDQIKEQRVLEEEFRQREQERQQTEKILFRGGRTKFLEEKFATGGVKKRLDQDRITREQIQKMIDAQSQVPEGFVGATTEEGIGFVPIGGDEIFFPQSNVPIRSPSTSTEITGDIGGFTSIDGGEGVSKVVFQTEPEIKETKLEKLEREAREFGVDTPRTENIIPKFGSGIVEGFTGTFLGIKALLTTNPIESGKAIFKSIPEIPSKVVQFGKEFKEQPAKGLGKVGFELAFLRGSSKTLKETGKAVDVTKARLSPKFTDPKTLPDGSRVVRVSKTGKVLDDFGIGATKKVIDDLGKTANPVLDAIDITKIPITEIIPKAENLRRIATPSINILDIERVSPATLNRISNLQRGSLGIVGKNQFPKELNVKTLDRFKDLSLTARGVLIDTPKPFIIKKATKQRIESLSATASGLTRIKEIPLKTKTPPLTPLKSTELDIPLIEGKFPQVSLKAQVKLAGTEVTAVSGARNFLSIFERIKKIDKPLSSKKSPKLESSLFFDPFGKLRTSRLGLGKQKDASLKDILSGDFTFKKSKPQALVIPKLKIEDVSPDIRRTIESGKALSQIQKGRLLKQQLIPTGKGKPIGFPGTEPEITLPKDQLVQKIGILGDTIIGSDAVKIIEIRPLTPTKGTQNLLKKTKLTKKERLDLTKRIEKESGFSSRDISPKPFVSPTATLSSVIKPGRSLLKTSSSIRSASLKSLSSIISKPSGITGTSKITGSSRITRTPRITRTTRTSRITRIPRITKTPGLARTPVTIKGVSKPSKKGKTKSLTQPNDDLLITEGFLGKTFGVKRKIKRKDLRKEALREIPLGIRGTPVIVK